MNWKIHRVLLLALLLSASIEGVQATPSQDSHGAASPGGHGVHWTYDGDQGPNNWGKLSPDYQLCGTGKEQSPIDITGGKPANLPGIGIEYPQTGLRIVNNGHTIQVSYGAEGGASLGDKPYRLVQFHFHSPSEHTVNGRPLAMEGHLVHKDAQGRLAVIGLLYKEGRANAFLDRFWKVMPKEAGPERSISDVTLRVADMLPKEKSYYHYNGSLTTPPCSEGVKWYVLKTPLEASAQQIRQFSALFVHNERPVQALGGRTIYSVRDTGEVVPVALAALGAAGGHDTNTGAGGHGGVSTGGDAHGAGAAESGAFHGKSEPGDKAGKKSAGASIWTTLGWIGLGLVALGAVLAAVLSLRQTRSKTMFKNLKIGMRLGLGFAAVLILLSALAVIGVMRVNELDAEIDDLVQDKMAKTELVGDVSDELANIARAERNMLIYRNDEMIRESLGRIADANKVIAATFEHLEKLHYSETGKKYLDSTKEKRAVYVEAHARFEEAVRAKSWDESMRIFNDKVRPTYDAYLKTLRDWIKHEDEAAKKVGEGAAALATTTMELIVALAVAAIAIGAGMAWWVTRSITKPIGEAVSVANALAEGDLTAKIDVDSTDETGMLKQAMKSMVEKLAHIIGEVRGAADALSSAAEEVSSTAQSLSQSSSEQAASVEETSASIEEMTASITQNTENAKVTDNMATKSSQEATEGGRAVNETVTAMKQIASKIGIIDDIAYQTNLLALNAAIEAARAGEHGKGFAVVAAEVRKLAERSQVAAQEIGELASNSVGMAEKAGKLLDEMVPSIKKTSDLVQEIAAASAEQSTGVGQINSAMGQLNKATQQNASASEELAATAEEMGGQAGQLQELMAFFTVADQGRGAGRSPARAAKPAEATARVAKPAARKAVSTPRGEAEPGDFERF